MGHVFEIYRPKYLRGYVVCGMNLFYSFTIKTLGAANIEFGNVSPGVRPALWLVDEKPVNYALIPTSQSARLVIAETTLAWRLEHKEGRIR